MQILLNHGTIIRTYYSSMLELFDKTPQLNISDDKVQNCATNFFNYPSIIKI